MSRASEEAVRRRFLPRNAGGLETHWEGAAFTDGARWMAEELLSDEAVEAAAAGMWDRHGKPGLFHHAPDHYREAFRADARAALTAALEAVK